MICDNNIIVKSTILNQGKKYNTIGRKLNNILDNFNADRFVLKFTKFYL